MATCQILKPADNLMYPLSRHSIDLVILSFLKHFSVLVFWEMVFCFSCFPIRLFTPCLIFSVHFLSFIYKWYCSFIFSNLGKLNHLHNYNVKTKFIFILYVTEYRTIYDKWLLNKYNNAYYIYIYNSCINAICVMVPNSFLFTITLSLKIINVLGT